jgi:hypothetical protein
VAVRENKEITYLTEMSPQEQWPIYKTLVGRRSILPSVLNTI